MTSSDGHGGGDLLFAVGSVLRGDDAAGPLLAKMFADAPVDGWSVIDGGQMPEDELSVVRRMAPSRIVVVDAAEMGLLAGSVRRIRRESVSGSLLLTTHSLPLSFLLGELEDVADEVVFIGIQPYDLSFFGALTPSVRTAVEELYERIAQGADLNSYEYL